MVSLIVSVAATQGKVELPVIHNLTVPVWAAVGVYTGFNDVAPEVIVPGPSACHSNEV
jgi:hypothetical protein